jgi:hypothetical protein
MAVLLADVLLSVNDDIVRGIVDEFQKSSYLLQFLPFADIANPVSGGGTFTTTYTRIKTQPTADTRAINSEYTPQEADREQVSASTAIFGGSFELDRAIAKVLSPTNIGSELALQITQKIKATRTKFHQMVITGDTGTDPDAFDGLSEILTGTSTEYNAGGTATIDLSTAAKVKASWEDMRWNLDEWLATFDGKPSAIFGNSKSILRLKQCAMYAGAYMETSDTWGRKVDNYDGIPLVDLGEDVGSTDPIIETNAVTSVSSLYAVRFGMDGFHGIVPTGIGSGFISIFMPDFTTAGAVKKGEVEMIAGIALKSTRAAGVYRDAMVVVPVPAPLPPPPPPP